MVSDPNLLTPIYFLAGSYEQKWLQMAVYARVSNKSSLAPFTLAPFTLAPFTLFLE
jgi:hypothetical protein